MHPLDDVVSPRAVQPARRPVVAAHVPPQAAVAVIAQGRLDRVQELNRTAVPAMLLGQEEVEAVDVTVPERQPEAAQVRMIVIGPPVVTGESPVVVRDEAARAAGEIAGEALARPRVATAAVEIGERGQRVRADLGDLQARGERDRLDRIEALGDDEQLGTPGSGGDLPQRGPQPVPPDEASDVPRERPERHGYAP